ncbi:Acetyltransferase (GNAT) family protein [Pseudoruegeria aquimaris]|uniref:Acetyltransferase (GNAT) family protein n=1 Tax=Pseudoruegeria aquimaris TaxID=393663 RepID=A0A1Y5SA15_9RHOB|nr:GNAT family N-acetyltransferase [Pseudoruegeria aquimaris]SLN35944.1 Acetyltransferase (GNAT) family protein [Pseudoruegeria aquimaris]
MAVSIAPAILPTPGKALAQAAQSALPVLETPRLVLRAPSLADFALYAELVAGQRAAYFGGPMTEAEAWADFANYCAGWLLRGDGVFAITRAGETIGFLFAGCEPGDEALELGFLLSAEAEGHGYAFEAAQAALDHLFALGTETVVSYIEAANTRARALAERLGGVLVHQRESGTCTYRYRPDDADGSPEAYA